MGVLEVDSGEDGQGRWVLRMDCIDPCCGRVDEFGSGRRTFHAADESVDQVEIEDGIVLAKGDGLVRRDGAEGGEVAWFRVI